MQKAMRKTISSILIGVILFSVTLEVQATEPAQEIETEEEEYDSDYSEGEVTSSDTEFSNDSAVEDKSDENDSTGIPKEMSEEAELEEDQKSEEDEELEAEDKSEEEEEPGEVYELTLEYDDRYKFADYDEVDLTEYSVECVSPETVATYQTAEKGNSKNSDTEVVTINDDSDGLIATDIGTEDIIFQKEDGSKITLAVTVEPATLSLLFIAGQSNAEGTSSSSTGSHPEDSVVCEEGQVYSTYAPSSSTRGKNNTGLDIGECTAANADSYVADSLTGNTSISGSTLQYPLNALSKSGKGKTGMDSGLAYKWNQLSGDKVWVVNAAVSATSITTWTPGGSYYNRAIAVFKDAVKTAKSEIDAGHYVLGDTLLFWLQGENDKSMGTSKYMGYFNDMVSGFESEGLGIQYYGIIIVRASTGSYVNSEDIYMTGPRIAQYIMGNDASSCPNIYVVSNANEQWVSDSGVKSYFQGVYGSTLTYPLRSGATISSVPTTVAKVHSDIHYAQVGHNENGLTAAESMYEIVHGGSGSSTSVCWYEEDGTKLSNGTTVFLQKNETYDFVPVVTPLSQSKGVSITLEGSGYSYNAGTGVLTVGSGGTGTLTAKVNGKSAALSLTTSSSTLSTPSLKSATADADGTTISWGSVSGAKGYAVYRKKSGGSWYMIGTTTSTSYTDTNNNSTYNTDKTMSGGVTYYYTVRAYQGTKTRAMNNKYDSAYWSSYDSTGVKSVYLAIPSLSSATTSASSTKVSWGKVTGATGYAVYRKLSGDSWSMISTTTSTSYTDSASLSSGKTYYYTVRAYYGNVSTAKNNRYNAAYWGGYNSTGLKAVYLSTPSLSSTKAAAKGTQVNWKSVSGASGYAVYRKLSGGSWSMIDTTTSTSYTDTAKLTAGKTYYYTVRAYTGSVSTAKNNRYNAAYWSGYNSTGLKSVYIAIPSLKSAKAAASGTTVSWSSVSKAGGYAVYRKKSGGDWSMIGTTTKTSYTDKSKLSGGKTYYYTVRAYYGKVSTAKNNRYSASYWGGYDSTGLKAVYLSTPSLSSSKAVAKGTQISWKSVTGASGYAVYRKKSGGGWSMIDTTTSTSYTDTAKLTAGKTYYYTVRAYTGSVTTAKNHRYNAAYWSGYNSTGLKSVYIAVPNLKSVKAASSGTTVSWSSVSKAGGYAVFRKEDSGSWSIIGTTTKTSYTDNTKLTAGKTYSYTVRACIGNVSTAKKHRYNAAYWGGYNSSGLSIIK